jgi:lipoic acid synthetase
MNVSTRKETELSRFHFPRWSFLCPVLIQTAVQGCFCRLCLYHSQSMSSVKIDPNLPHPRKPEWIKVRLPSNPVFFSTKSLISDLRLHTVCEEAQCPNRWECWSQGTATFMIAGERCTRACGFCAVSTAKPFPLEVDEPERVASAVRRMKLKHVVVTAVARDDLKDGGAEHFARTIEAIRAVDPEIVIEVLVPDFHAGDAPLKTVLDAAPHVFNHNIETVERLTPLVRSRAKYRVSLSVLRKAKEMSPKVVTKSGLMLGLGEKEDELFQTLDDLLENGVRVLTMGQYLRPTPNHLPVVEYIHPDQFRLYSEIAYSKGFEHVSSGPLVRSSYHAADYHPVPR